MTSKTELKWDRLMAVEKIERQQKKLANLARQRDELQEACEALVKWAIEQAVENDDTDYGCSRSWDALVDEGAATQQILDAQAAIANADWLKDWIETSPKKLDGNPVLRKTRFSIAQLFAELADGDSVEGIAEDFDLDASQIRGLLRALSRHTNLLVAAPDLLRQRNELREACEALLENCIDDGLPLLPKKYTAAVQQARAVVANVKERSEQCENPP